MIPEIHSLLDEWRTILITKKESNKIADLSLTISNSMHLNLTDIPNIKSKISDIDNLPLNQRVNKYQNLLNFARLFYSEYLDKVHYKNDLITKQLVEEYNGPDNYISFKNKYFNKAIANMVLKNGEPEKLFIQDNTIRRKYEPIFMTPTNPLGRAQFYSPEKRFGTKYYKTIYFNAFIIWVITLILYIILVFDLIQKIKINHIHFLIKHLKIRIFRTL
jgi:hypothetical protein